MTTHDDFAVEPIRGLPERPPAGEVVLWQGRPDAWSLALEAMHLPWIAGYFALLAIWRVGVSSASMSFQEALPHATPFVILGVLASAIVLLIAWVQSRMTVYTVTTARVALRIGAALTVTLNLPYTRIARADFDQRKGGTGTIAFTTAEGTRLSYLVLWPHVRPWHVRNAQPALRCIPDAARVARIIAEAAGTRLAQPRIAQRGAPARDAVAAE